MVDFANIFSSAGVWLLIFAGVVWGMLIGALPGVAGTLAMVLVLPFTFVMPISHALVLLMSCYTSSIYGGSISAILLSIPGTGGNVVTTFDGYPMAQQGRAGLALGGAAVASFVGNIISCAILLFVGPIYVNFALKFGNHEMFMVALWGFVISIFISSGKVLKNVIAGLLGVVLSCIGIGAKYGVARLTFDSSYLLTGIPLVPAIVGIFGFCVVLQSVTTHTNLINTIRQKVTKISGFKQLTKFWSWIILIVSSGLGFIVGCIPGTGSLVATLLAYGIFKKVSNRGAEYGKGCEEGILVAESANNATHPGAILTTLILGIPGEMAMVVLLGAFTIHGLRCGPLLLVQNPEILPVIFWSIMISGLVTFVLALTTLRGWAKAIETPKAYLWPVVLLLCIIGTYSINSSINDVLLMVCLGVLAFWIENRGFSKIPLMMGLVLGPIMEDNLRMALQLEPIQAFLVKPIVIVLFVITVLTCLAYLWLGKTQKCAD